MHFVQSSTAILIKVNLKISFNLAQVKQKVLLKMVSSFIQATQRMGEIFCCLSVDLGQKFTLSGNSEHK